MKNNQIESVQKKTEKTKKYDMVADKVRKLLTATATTYIKELCEALSEDWYPHLSHDTIQIMEEPRQEIRNKVLDDWSKERNPQGGLWKADSIETHYFPKWLKDQYFNRNPKGTLPLDDENRLKKFSQKAEQQKSTLDNIAKNLPDVPEEEQEIGRQEPEPTVINYSQGISQSNKKPKPTPQELYEAGVTHAEKLWMDLTGLDSLITSDQTDALIDFVKPTRQYRLRIFKGLDEQRSVHYQNCLIRLDVLIQDTLKMCQEINSEKKQEISE